MAYVNEQPDGKPEVQYGLSDVLTYYAKANGEPVTVDASSAFVTILDPNGGIKVPRQSAIIASGGKLSLTRTWNETIEEDYIAVWEWSVGSNPFADRFTFDVVLTKLPCLIDTSTLQELYPNIVSHLNAIGETDATKFARTAWSLILDRIRSGGHRPSLILDRRRLVNPGKQLMAALTCNALARTPGDLWSERARDHLRSFESLFVGLGELKYDRNEDGTADDIPARINRVRGWV